jgi:hypothetical protein
MAEVNVNGGNVTDVMLALQPPLHFSGRLTFDASTGPQGGLDPTRVRVSLGSGGGSFSAVISGTAFGSINPPPGVVRPDGTFEITSILPGTYRISAFIQGSPPGWSLRSAIVNGRDVLDVPLELGQSDVSNAVLTFSDRSTELAGTLRGASGGALTDFVVLVFPEDRTLWRPGARRIKFARPATDGEFIIRDLPAGDYLLSALPDLDPDDAFSPAFLAQLVPASVRITIGEGEKKRQDLGLAR